jgi:hypothetical protein
MKDQPVIGDPTSTAIPWHKDSSPKALVNLLIPSSSTMTMDRSAINAAKNNAIVNI